MKTTVYIRENIRSRVVGKAMAEGINSQDDICNVVHSSRYTAPDSDVALFYGLGDNIPKIRNDYINSGRKAILIDLGYWGRTDGGKRLNGYHRFAINSLHGYGYLQNRRHDSLRFDKFNLHIKPFNKTGTKIIICGQSKKAAKVYGLEWGQYERWVYSQVKTLTNKEIIYRPKKTLIGTDGPIEGTVYKPDGPFVNLLNDAHLVISHHSNCGIDAILNGVPIFTADGLASILSSNLLCPNTPHYPTPGQQKQFLHDAAYQQYNVSEMKDGTAWRYIRRLCEIPTVV